MEKRILADQGNALIDLCKVREASVSGKFLSQVPTPTTPHLTFLNPLRLSLSYTRTCWHHRGRDLATDAEPDVRRAVGGAGLPGRAGHAHPQPGEERGGAEGGLQDPDAAPVQHSVHAELLHPTPAQREGGEDGDSRRQHGQVEEGQAEEMKKRLCLLKGAGAELVTSGLSFLPEGLFLL